MYLRHKDDADRLLKDPCELRKLFGEDACYVEYGQRIYSRAKRRGGFTDDAQLQSEEGLVKVWYISKRCEMIRSLRFARRKLSTMSGEYFAVIGDKLFRVGYATAEKYWNSFQTVDLLLADLSSKIALSPRILKKEVPFRGNDPLSDLVMSQASEGPYHRGDLD